MIILVLKERFPSLFNKCTELDGCPLLLVMMMTMMGMKTEDTYAVLNSMTATILAQADMGYH